MSTSTQFKCFCGWTLISPLGWKDAMRYGHLHIVEAHPEMIMLPLEKMRSEFLSDVGPGPITVATQ